MHPNIRNAEGWTPLHVAAFVGHGPTAAVLIRAGADVNARAAEGGTPVRAAVEGGQCYMARYLASQGADVNLPDDRGRTPLEVVAAKCDPRGLRYRPPRMAEALRSVGGQVRTLHAAVALGDRERVAELAAAGADPNERDAEGHTPLHVLVLFEYNYHYMAETLLKAGADPSLLDREGRTALIASIDAGTNSLLLNLKRVGLDPNVPDAAGWTPLDHLVDRTEPRGSVAGLSWQTWQRVVEQGGTGTTLAGAVAAGDTARARAALEAGADPNEPTSAGWPPLYWALVAGDGAATARLLLEAGANPNSSGPKGGGLLHRASHDPTMARLLLDHGADPNARDPEGNTPLHANVRFPPMVEMLLALGADPNAANDAGDTPLHVSACAAESVALLVRGGADPNALNSAGESIAVPHNQCCPIGIETVRYLLEHGMNPNLATGFLRPPSPPGTEELLRRHGADEERIAAAKRPEPEARPEIDEIERYGMTKLQYEVWNWYAMVEPRDPRGMVEAGAELDLFSAAGMDELARVREFVEAGVDPDLRHPQNQSTPLHWAAHLDRPDVAAYLIAQGAHVNARDEDGRTPLHAAIWYGPAWGPSDEILLTLMEAGAELNARNRDGETPLSLIHSEPMGWLMFERGAVM